jgi:SSS family solute:Na+ symporter
MAHILSSLRIFDASLGAMGLRAQAITFLVMALPAAFVLAYFLLGGLTGTLYNLAVQFCLIVAAFLPLTFLGIKEIGGWSKLKAIPASTALLPQWGGTTAGGAGSLAIAVLAGLVLSAGFWCADFRVLQVAMAAKDARTAKRAPLFAAAAWLVVPLLFVLAGIMATGLPTPHSTTLMSVEGESIVRTTTVVPLAAEAGHGLVPAQAEAKTGRPLTNASGQPLLDYEKGLPNVLTHFLPSGLLGFGLAALLASMMAGMAASIAAFSSVFTCDLYEPFLSKEASEEQTLETGRLAAAGAALLALIAACACEGFGFSLGAWTAVIVRLTTPFLAIVLLGMFWKRASGHGAFAGLVAGMIAALLAGGNLLGQWNSSDSLAQSVVTAIAAFGVALVVTAIVSFCTEARPEAELTGLVYACTPCEPCGETDWRKRPTTLAGAILLLAILMTILFS